MIIDTVRRAHLADMVRIMKGLVALRDGDVLGFVDNQVCRNAALSDGTQVDQVQKLYQI